MSPRASRRAGLAVALAVALATPAAPLLTGPASAATLTGQVWASDLPFVSSVNGNGPVERDESNGTQAAGDGRTIWVGGKSHSKGLGVHADSAVRFDVGGSCEYFQSEVGIDDEVGDKGSVVFSVVADGVQVAQTKTVTGSMEPITIYAGIDGAQTVDLLVSQAEGGAAYDHADWASAKFRCSGDGTAPAATTPAAPTTSVYAGNWPFLGTPSNGWGPVERNQENGEEAAGDGGPLKLNGVTYTKGLGVHAGSMVSYHLGGGCSAFTAKVGVDDSQGWLGSARFRVFADGVEVADTGKMLNGTATKTISATTAGARRLDLLVDDTGDGVDYDHADWADARLVCGNDATGAAFYTPPSTLPAGRGTLVRTEPSQFWVTPLKITPVDATATRLMYTSTDRNDTSIAVTGQLVVPNKAWSGSGSRPLIAYAVGTQGLGDECAPSRLSDGGGLEYENVFLAGLLAKGYAVVVTDYQGLGTPGLHTYMSREVQARAVLDSVRAARNVSGSGVTSSTPVALMGYSQGGGAAAAAAEIAHGYAPDLNVVGVAAGGIPGDLLTVADKLDGSFAVGFLAYAVLGVGEASYGIDVSTFLNARGSTLMDAVREECVVETVLKHPFVQSSTLTKDGRSLPQTLRDPQYATMLDEQRIGNGRKPTIPAFVYHSQTDDVVAYAAGYDAAKRWCAQGATVSFRPGLAPGHVGGAFGFHPYALSFLDARFRGEPSTSTCATI
ncbi:alpha/beta fold hydrolase [Nocardioides panzhihuensis]|uniref:Alpha-beta hydrolase superfamily lysophospholipase n=1 Tax=Nocardioides panzhihuensis TaxID=860243 RepID=A0A7Z0ITP5_9ACTN|nr:alpha/beta fold hydrolase [Nocardioides panzhihuensis]NYI79145.1 alpha-beta hydrolase superfamily lysophospholipase [Nocardioides panzhihuensis]